MTLQGGKYIEVGPGVEVFVQDVGSGDPLVFLFQGGLLRRKFFANKWNISQKQIVSL